MEEAQLLKERLQAITEKKKVQEDIANKRAEIDEEKLKLQYLKKKALREQWLMEGQGAPGGQGTAGGQGREATRQRVQDDQEQIRALQSSIHRMEKLVEDLEREEVMISANEVFILQRLKAIEKSPEDIIKAAKCETLKEPVVHVCCTPNVTPSHRSPHTPGPDADKQTPATIVAINVQEHRESEESQVLSAATVTPQRFQQNGARAYDSKTRSAYALQLGEKDFHNGMDELSPMEVEQLLRTSSMHTYRTVPQYCEVGFPSTHQSAPSLRRQEADQVQLESNGLHSSNSRVSLMNPEFIYSDSGQLWDSRHQSPSSYIPPLYHGTHEGQCPQTGRHSSKGSSKIAGSNQNPKQRPYDSGETLHMDPQLRNLSPALDLHNAKGNLLSAMPPHLDFSKPVTMIFMGYQHVSDDEAIHTLGYDGAIQAELVVIASDEDESTDCGILLQPGRSSGVPQSSLVPTGTCNMTNALPPPHQGHSRDTGPGHCPPISSPEGVTDGSITEDASTTGTKKLPKRVKWCCSLM